MEEIFKCNFLDDVYEARTNGCLNVFLKDFKNEEGDYGDIYNKIKEIINNIPDENIKNQLEKEFEHLDSSYQNELLYLSKEHYKFGLTDGTQMAMEMVRRGDMKLK